MRFAELVETSGRVRETRSRLDKVALLSATLARMSISEIATGISCLAGDLPGGRVGIGYATLRAIEAPAAAGATPSSVNEGQRGLGLELADVERALAGLALETGPGSAGRRSALLGDLLGRASAAERNFLVRLFAG